MPGEVLLIHIGQFGIQTSSALWQLLCMEHGIGPDGVSTDGEEGDDNRQSVFQLLNNDKYMPRCIMVDSEPSVLGEIKTGAYKDLFNPFLMVNGLEDSANNFARGTFRCGGEIIKKFRKAFRRTSEQVDNKLSGVMLFNGVSGGTGSGCGSLVVQELALNSPKVPRMELCLYPSQVMASSVVEPYNATFHLHTTMEEVDLSAGIDNESLYSMCKRVMMLNAPSFSSINKMIGMTFASCTATMRFPTKTNTDMNGLYTNLVPFPYIHHVLVRHAPFCNKFCTSYGTDSTDDITLKVFSDEYQTLKAEFHHGKFIAIFLNYRGLVSQGELSTIIPKTKIKCRLDFVDWAPTGFKLALNTSIPIITPGTKLGTLDRMVSMMANTTSIKNAFDSVIRKFDLLFAKRSFTSWYINEGMEMSEFLEAKNGLLILLDNYKEIEMTDDELINIARGLESKDFDLNDRSYIDDETNIDTML